MPALPFVRDLLGWKEGVANTADKDSTTSCAIAAEVLEAAGITHEVAHAGQTAGRLLEEAVHEHLHAELALASGLPGISVSRRTTISDFAQYEHLARLQRLIDADETRTLRATIGTDYQIKPDVTVGVDPSLGLETPLLHAAVPCKWTLRSDRAQNVRHEAVILIRLRRGRLPHIVPVTAEPLPTRLASLARGTGEVDALFHVALDELTAACDAVGNAKQRGVLEELVGHNRLRDLSVLIPTLAL